MAILKNSFEYGTNGSIITSANSSDASNNNFNAVSVSTVTFDTTHAMHGTKAAKLQAPGGSPTDSVVFRWTQGISSTMSARMYVYMTSNVTADHHLLHFRTANNVNRVASLHLNGASRLRLSDATGTTGVWTAASAMPINQWVRIEMYAKPGTSTTDGELSLGVYLADSTTPIESVYSSNVRNLGTAGIDTIVFGKNSNSSYADAFWIDDVYANDSLTGLPGPFITAPTSENSPLYHWNGTSWQRITLYARDSSGWHIVS